MKYPLILLALVALPATADYSEDKLTCETAMEDEFYPQYKFEFETMIGCINPTICGGVWSSFGYETRRFPSGKRFTVWCRIEDGEVDLSESNPDKVVIP